MDIIDLINDAESMPLAIPLNVVVGEVVATKSPYTRID
jgi:hypothetical protein